MRKLSKRKRKEQNDKRIKNTYVKVKDSKKLHKCIMHSCKEQSDGGYLCKICGHYFDDIMAEQILKNYFDSRTTFSLNEIRNMKISILSVIYTRNEDGNPSEISVEELKEYDALAYVNPFLYFLDCITPDLEFRTEGIIKNKYESDDWGIVLEDINYFTRVPSFQELETIFDFNTKVCINNYIGTAENWCYVANRKMFYYEVFPPDLISLGKKNNYIIKKVIAKRYVFSETGEVECVKIRLSTGEIYTLTK